ncbi:MAG: alginate lyase family protein [Hahellaceae bacterium]|nr:alginate lyase family protein [Hahellaceae bacterium]
MLVEKIAWMYNRLRCMSFSEIVHRFVVAMHSTMEKRGLRLAITPPAPEFSAPPLAYWIHLPSNVDVTPYIEKAEKIISGYVDVFSMKSHEIGNPPQWNKDPKTGIMSPLTFGKSLDYRNEAIVGDIKYLWEPSRHLQLVSLAQAYALSSEEKYADAFAAQLKSWLEQCPYMMGPHWTSSLELGIRLINWAICWQLLGGSQCPIFRKPEFSNLLNDWLTSIYQHVHFINGHYSGFSSANNHLIGEAAGAYIATKTWPHWNAFRHWESRARQHLEREALLQNYADGVNKEQAISYQQFVYDFLGFAGLCGKAHGSDFPRQYWANLERMAEFLASVMDCSGNVPMIGDADDGYVNRLDPTLDFCPYQSILMTSAVLFDRADLAAKCHHQDHKTLWLTGRSVKLSPEGNAGQSPRPFLKKNFHEGGYHILGSDFDTPAEVRIVMDTGPLGYLGIAAHGHADALTFVLSSKGEEVLIDPGTYAYHTQKKWRNYFRGTLAHNTLTIDGENQSVIGGNFMWLDKAETQHLKTVSDSEHDLVSASHNGYMRLKSPATHRRTLTYHKKTRILEVVDLIESSGPHMITICWHFPEWYEVEATPDGHLICQGKHNSVTLTPEFKMNDLKLVRGDDDRPAGWISRSFDHKQAAWTAIYSVETRSNIEFRTIISGL